MGPRALVFWGAAAVVSTAAAVTLSLQASDRIVDAAKLDEPVFPDLVAGPEGAAAITVSQGGESVTVRLEDGTWVVPDRYGYRADVETVREVVTGLTGLRFAAPRTALPERFARLEVDEPGEGSEAQRVAVHDAAGTPLADAILGKRSQAITGTQRGTYLRLPDGERAWLASGTVDVPTAVVDWLDTSLPSLARDELKTLVVTPADGEGFTVGRLAAAEDLTLVDRRPEGRRVDPDAIRRLADVFNALRFDDVRPASEVAWPATATRLEATGFDDEIFQAELATVDGTTWVRLGPSAEWVYVLPQFQLDRMDLALDDLLLADEAS